MPNIISNAQEHKDLVTEAPQEKHVVSQSANISLTVELPS